MKIHLSKLLSVTAATVLCLGSVLFNAGVRAEDTDIFTVNPNITAQRPNVLIMLDNTANWNTAFTNEKSALVTTVQGLDDRFNVGLGMFVETGNPNDNVDGAYVRAGVRRMTTTNKTALANMVGGLDQTFDKGNNATYGLAMAELYRYFAGLTSVSGIGKAKRDYPGNTLGTSGNQANNNPALAYSNTLWALPGNSFASSTSSTYVSPIADDCAKNFIIFISNGPANDNASATSTATAALQSAGGSTAAIPLTPNGEQNVIADEWARFISNSDISARTGTQNIVTYTIDINPGSQNADLAHTALLKSMAAQGKGTYFAVSSAGGGAEIAEALNKIFKEVLATNSVFASATLPVSVNTRGTFLNQVYMGVFRPDGQASPRWPGNLKQFKTYPDANGQLQLVDSTSTVSYPNGAPVEDTTKGFLKNNITSFWSTPSSFWNATYYPDVQGAGGVSDAPDGDLVEKGGAAQRLRGTYPNNLSPRKVYTCTGTCGASSGQALSNYPFSTGNSTLMALNASDWGLVTPVNISSIVRSGNTATVTTTATHGLTSGQSVTISGANQSEYNGPFTVLASPAPTATTFAITVTEQPASPATGSITITKSGGAAVAITNLVRQASNDATGTLYTDTATATSAAHGLSVGNNVTITGAAQAEYNSSFTVTAVTANTFSFQVPVNPGAPTVFGSAGGKGISALSRAGKLVSVSTTTNHGFATGNSIAITGMTPAAYNGTYTITKTGNRDFTYTLTSNLTPATPATTTSSITFSTSAITVNPTSMVRALGSTSVTVTTAAAHGLSVGNTISVTGATQSAYNIQTTVATVPSSTTFTYNVTLSPVSPATGTMTAQASVSVTNTDIINWVRGANARADDNPSNLTTDVRAYLHGDVVHSRPAIINYNRSGQNAGDGDVAVFYGSNDGIFHAIKGGQTSTDGYELWGFVAPEHFVELGRQYSELPAINNAFANTSKPYFSDGVVATLTVDGNNDGQIDASTAATTGDAAYIYISMRRGGRFIYAMDVTDPATPKLQWKISSTQAQFAELGQTWAEPKVAKIKGYANPVLIISAGYDAVANDVSPAGTATMGRGVYIVDAITGAALWYAGPNTTVAGLISGSRVVSGMTWAIPADASPIDSDGDGFVDRIYLADTGGNLWRANISATTAAGAPDYAAWSVFKIAALGQDSGANCTSSTNGCRKFLFAPDVVQYDTNTDSVLLGSGDREQPFEVQTINRFFMVKDSHALVSSAPASPLIAADLYDATQDLVQVGTTAQKTAAQTSLAAKSGWYVNLNVYGSSSSQPYLCTLGNDAQGKPIPNYAGCGGEKVVTKAITVGGTTVFGTNIPESVVTTAGGNTCSSGLGEARLYSLNFKDASAVSDTDANGLITATDRFAVRAGGGLPPSPIAITVSIDGKIYEGVGSGATILKSPGTGIGARSLIYWNMLTESK